ncbi:MAG: DUF1795 domain-containing protein [Pyrinomonadaceae bacterium]|nr:DUF1795 domain-containing protein [Pyrinomonadaceae bacterium]
MKSNKLLFSVFLGLFFAVAALAQTPSFSDPNVEYTFDVPDAEWKQTVKPSTTSPNVEYVFKDRSEAHLEIRRMPIKAGETLADTMGDEEQRLQFLPGYVAGKEEDFKGALNGRAFNYEFIRSARNMSGRFYFIKADDKTVYVLRFTGQRDKLRSLRNQTDSMARTFAVKKVK